MHMLLQHLLFLLQGGAGIYVDYGGEATLTNTNVYDNYVNIFANMSWHLQTVPPFALLECCVYSWLAGSVCGSKDSWHGNIDQHQCVRPSDRRTICAWHSGTH